MSLEIILVFTVLIITIVLFVTELLRVDVIALLVLVSLPLLGLIEPEKAFSGFSSNAVISIIAVMILGYGIDQSGVMKRLIKGIFHIAGKNEQRLFCIISLMIGAVSAFMQNIGVVALFLPALLKITKHTGISPSRFLMPMGFSAILGGTLSMIGSGPLILLNDLIEHEGLRAFSLFSVTPVGLTLLAAGIAFFLVFGKHVLPERPIDDRIARSQQNLIDTWNLPRTIFEVVVCNESPLIGKTLKEAKIRKKYGLYIIAFKEKNQLFYAPWGETLFTLDQKLGILGNREDVKQFAADYHLKICTPMKSFNDLQSMDTAGFAEVIIAPHSPIIGKTMHEIALHKNYGVEPLVIFSSGVETRDSFSDKILKAGDEIIIYGHWEYIQRLSIDKNFIVITPIESVETKSNKEFIACLCFLFSILMAIAGIHLPIALLTGALGMILFGVIRIEEAYKAINWQTVFLLAGLIPLGIAMKQTGAAKFLAFHMIQIVEGKHILYLLFSIAALTTVFSLFMSNIAATVLMVPLVIDMGKIVNFDPRYLALLVGITASNSFLLPTHQVNALLMSPGKYRNRDFLKAGGIMTIIFLCVTVSVIYFFYL